MKTDSARPDTADPPAPRCSNSSDVFCMTENCSMPYTMNRTTMSRILRSRPLHPIGPALRTSGIMKDIASATTNSR